MTTRAARLMAEKILREVFRVSQAYGHTPSVSFDDLLHDLTLMIQHNDLERVRLLFSDRQRRTLLAVYPNGHVRSPSALPLCRRRTIGCHQE